MTEAVAVCQLPVENLAVARNLERIRAHVEGLAERVSLATSQTLARVVGFVEESAAFTREEVTALLLVGTWPDAYSVNWRSLVRAPALDGVHWVLGANRTREKDVSDTSATTYAGRSLVARPDGGVHRALDRQERTLVTDPHPAVLADQRALVGIFSDGERHDI